MLGPNNAIWDDGEWVSWAELDYHYEQQLLREQYPHADASLIPIFEDLLDTAEEYHRLPSDADAAFGRSRAMFTRGSIRSSDTECPSLGGKARTISRACLPVRNPAAIARQAAEESSWIGADGSANSSDAPIFRPADIPATASKHRRPY